MHKIKQNDMKFEDHVQVEIEAEVSSQYAILSCYSVHNDENERAYHFIAI